MENKEIEVDINTNIISLLQESFIENIKEINESSEFKLDDKIMNLIVQGIKNDSDRNEAIKDFYAINKKFFNSIGESYERLKNPMITKYDQAKEEMMKEIFEVLFLEKEKEKELNKLTVKYQKLLETGAIGKFTLRKICELEIKRITKKYTQLSDEKIIYLKKRKKELEIQILNDKAKIENFYEFISTDQSIKDRYDNLVDDFLKENFVQQLILKRLMKYSRTLDQASKFRDN